MTRETGPHLDRSFIFRTLALNNLLTSARTGYFTTMSDLSLKDLHQRIANQNAELQRLRQQLEARQSQFATLNKRRQVLQAELQQVEKELAAVAEGRKASLLPPKAVPKKKPAAKTVAPKETAALSLPALLVVLIREAGRPLSLHELVAQVKRRGFQSTSTNFAKMLQTRVYDLLKKGLVVRAADQSGFILSKSGNKSATKGKPKSR
jgi:septal ring factor EnvC (AmiA/AmiB activator)